jgi:hypothetical protein
VLEETDNLATVLARYTTESGSGYQPLHHMWRSSAASRFPLYDGIGTVRLGPPDERGPLKPSALSPEQFAPPGAREVLKYRRVGPEVRVYLDDKGYVTCVRHRAESARWLGWGERDG